MNRRECELDKPEYPPIGETLHHDGSCYCYLCTCGTHKCPSETKRPIPKLKKSSTYRSTFQFRYSPSPYPPEASINKSSLTQSKNRMEFRSTVKESFPIHPISSPLRTTRTEQKLYSYRMLGNSTYRNNFVNWGNYKSLPRKIMMEKTPSYVKFSGISTYKKDFVPKREDLNAKFYYEHKKIDLKKSQSFLSLETTNQSSFKTIDNKSYPKRINRANKAIPELEVTKNHFQTTYSNNFLRFSSKRQIFTKKEIEKLNKSGYS